MQDSPLVSIVIPVFNDEDWISAALESALQQTLTDIEIICVDDASSDSSRTIIERYQRRDSRVQLITQEHNSSAFQARRLGILAANAPYVMFLDGDDELAPQAAAKASALALREEADMVGFGVNVVANGKTIGGYQERLQPRHDRLEGEDVLRGLFPAGQPAQGQLWRYLFSTNLLRRAYSLLPSDLVLPRINDLPITFLAEALATRYVSLPDRLYRYYFRRGGSGHQVADFEQFRFYARAIDSVESLADAVRGLARKSPDPGHILDAYQTARRSITANVLDYLVKSTDKESVGEYLAHLYTLVSKEDVVLAAAEYSPDAISVLAKHHERLRLGSREVRKVLLTTKDITTGGVSLVLLAQAHYLATAGHGVVIAARNPCEEVDGLPEGVQYVQVTGETSGARLAHWAEICRSHSIDAIIDHQILYSRDWPSYALIAAASGVPTIGWVHNFAMRSVYDMKDMVSFIREHSPSLATLVTLSELDVAFWKLQGIQHSVYLPNPPSPMLLKSAALEAPKTGPTSHLELIWWGRLEQHTKQVRQLVDVAVELKKQEVDFRLRIIGPEWANLTPKKLHKYAERRGVGTEVEVPGPLRGQALLDAIDAADIFVNTSIIEGYPLTLAEAQARGLPIAMYEMDWLTIVQGNAGIVSAPQGDAYRLAVRIKELAHTPGRYAEASQAALDTAQRALALDFSEIYHQLLSGSLPKEYSPEPSLDDAEKLIDYIVFFAERNAGRGGMTGTSTVSRQRKLLYAGLKKANRMVPGMKPLKRRVKRLLVR